MLSKKQIHINNSDDDLLHDFQSNNNQQALAGLYLRYHSLVYGVCLKYLKNSESSKDAVMEIYYDLAKKLQQHQVENFKSWLYTVAKNYCLMQLRKSKNNRTTEFDSDSFMQFEDYSHLDSVLEREQSFNRLEFCLKQLNDEQNLVINLFYLQRKCYNEIVDTTKFDWNKVRSLVQNGRRNLKICMEENYG